MLREQMMELHYMIREVIERVGEALIDAPEPVRVTAAREVIARRGDLYNCVANLSDFSLWIMQAGVAALLAELEKGAVKLRNGGLGEQPIGILYRSEGIEFAALVEIEQIQPTAKYRGWTGEDLRRLGKQLAGGDELRWLDDEYAEIRSATGHLRKFYRRH